MSDRSAAQPLTVLFLVLYALIAITGATLVVFRRRLYRHGYPKVTTPMYAFTTAHGTARVVFYSLGHYMNDHPWLFFTRTGAWQGFSLMFSVCNILFFCMFWYHLMTWVWVVHPRKTEGTRDRLNFICALLCTATTVMDLTTKIISIIQGAKHRRQTKSVAVAEMLAFMIMTLLAVVITILYLLFRGRVVVLIEESQLDAAAKHYRIAKVNTLMRIFLLCLVMLIPNMMLNILACVEVVSYADIPTTALMVCSALPEFIADTAVLYFFSPLSIASDAPSRSSRGFGDVRATQMYYVDTAKSATVGVSSESPLHSHTLTQ